MSVVKSVQLKFTIQKVIQITTSTGRILTKLQQTTYNSAAINEPSLQKITTNTSDIDFMLNFIKNEKNYLNFVNFILLIFLIIVVIIFCFKK